MDAPHRSAFFPLAALVGLLVSATGEPARAQRLELPTPERYELDNGLEVVLQQDRRRPRVAVVVTYHVGARDDPPGHRDLAHLTEHMTYRGSRHLQAGEALTMIEDAGGRGNGRVTSDSTQFYAVVPSEQLPLALWIESQRMAFTLEAMSDDHLEAERAIVHNEWQQGDRADALVTEAVQQALYPPGHPYHHLADTGTDVEGLELDHVRWFYQQYYRPTNATLVVVGDFDEEVARGLVQRAFGHVHSFEGRGRVDAPPVRLTGSAKLTLAARVPENTVAVHWLAPCSSAECLAELGLLSFVLVHGRAGILEEALLDAGLPARVRFRIAAHAEGVGVEIASGLNDAAQGARALAVIQQQVERLREHPVDPALLELARNTLALQILQQLDSVLEQALVLARKPYAAPVEILAHAQAITAEELRDAAARWLPEACLRVVVRRDTGVGWWGEFLERDGLLVPVVGPAPGPAAGGARP